MMFNEYTFLELDPSEEYRIRVLGEWTEHGHFTLSPEKKFDGCSEEPLCPYCESEEILSRFDILDL